MAGDQSIRAKKPEESLADRIERLEEVVQALADSILGGKLLLKNGKRSLEISVFDDASPIHSSITTMIDGRVVLSTSIMRVQRSQKAIREGDID